MTVAQTVDRPPEAPRARHSLALRFALIVAELAAAAVIGNWTLVSALEGAERRFGEISDRLLPNFVETAALAAARARLAELSRIAGAVAARGFAQPAARSSGRPPANAPRLPFPGGRCHFFPRRSFSAALSSMASASIRFSRLFSSPSAFRRRASDTFNPPYFAFHL